MVFRGSTSGSIYSSPLQQAGKIISYTIVNKTGGAASVQVVIMKDGESDTHINSQSIAANEQYQSDVPIILKRNFYIHIIASAAIDFYFNIE